MNISELVRSRYTAKAYDNSKKLSDEQIQQIKDLLRFAPSSVNSQPWHFILATSDEAKEKIAKSAEKVHPKNVENIENCSLAIVFCVKNDIDTQYLDNLLTQEKNDGRFPNAEMEVMQKAGRGKFTALHTDILKDEAIWMEKQVYLNLGFTMLGIATMGLDSTPMEGIDAHIIDEEFNLVEKGYRTAVVITVGYSSKDDFNKNLPKSRLGEENLFTQL